MKILKSLLIWMSIIPLAILNGGLRNELIEPLLGNEIALPLSGVLLSLCIFLVTWILLPKLKNGTANEFILTGAVWFILTNLFDLLMIVMDGRELSEFFAAFNLSSGNLWCLVVLTTFISPIVVAKNRKMLVPKMSSTLLDPT